MTSKCDSVTFSGRRKTECDGNRPNKLVAVWDVVEAGQAWAGWLEQGRGADWRETADWGPEIVGLLSGWERFHVAPLGTEPHHFQLAVRTCSDAKKAFCESRQLIKQD